MGNIKMTDTTGDVQKLERIERTLGTLIVWLHAELGADNAKKLLEMLRGEE